MKQPQLSMSISHLYSASLRIMAGTGFYGKNVKVGDEAPDFNLPDEKNRNRSLKEFLGQKVVLVFFVGAFTSECTKELCVFRDSVANLIDLNAQVVGIDICVPSASKGLAKKNMLSFPILSDYTHEVIERYGLEVPDFARGGSDACCWGTGCYPRC